MLKPFRHTTYEDIVAHANDLIARMQADEEFLDIAERADAMGVRIAFSVRHTCTEEVRATARPDADPTGALPWGYAMEIWIDLVRDGRVLASHGETGDHIQYSVTIPAAAHLGGLIFTRVSFTEYENVIKQSQPFALLEEYLDAIEENGADGSPFCEDALCPDSPVGDLCFIPDLSGVGEGSYVEISPREYDGSVGGEDAVFFGTHAFYPYKLLLLAVVSPDRLSDAALTLNGEETRRFADILMELPEVVRVEASFSDVLSSCGVTAFAPPPNAERLLNAVTLLRESAFLGETDRFVNWLWGQINDKKLVTFIW